jgi:Domain of unknown function (DUF5060)/Putative collagen-binding domain of a collagenase
MKTHFMKKQCCHYLKNTYTIIFIVAIQLVANTLLAQINNTPLITGELKKWHKVTFTFNGPDVAETDKLNPFMNYRLDAYFTHEATGEKFKVPGYFAADGNAAQTSATSGSKWRVHFAPNKLGVWKYKIDFRVGNWLAVSERKNAGISAEFMDGVEGSFTITESDKKGIDNRAKGFLQYDGTRYLKYAETGKAMLKVGPDAPENFLAYADFDGTFHNDGHKDDLVKNWDAHVKDWKDGNPIWKDGKGKGIIGAINYLAEKGMNVFSFLTLNIKGDDQNVFPFINYDTYDRYDCSKLDQWEMVLDHADKMGMFLHVKLVEQECQGLLDNGAIGAFTKLYYREIMARFGHHLSLNWNCGEESGDWVKNHITPPMNTTQRLAAAEYFHQNDPYHHHIVIHNPPSFEDILDVNSKFTGVSYQQGSEQFRGIHQTVLKWLKLSKEAGKQWAFSMDEPGGAQHSLLPDNEDANHDSARINCLWGSFLAGAWGNEFYFGYAHPHSDLTCQDFRSRDLFWNQCKYLLDFFENNKIPVTQCENYDELVQKNDYCFAKPDDTYIVFLKNGTGTIDLQKFTSDFSVKWYNPRNGGKLQTGSIKTLKGGSIQNLGNAPSEPQKDWVVLITKK